LYRNHACSPASQLVCVFLGEISPECHPERGSACTTESKFCGAEQREAKQNRERDERQRTAGSRMGFLNICSASVAFTKRTQPDYVRILPCANKRVINRSEIPLRATALALLLTAMRPRRILVSQKFDCVRSLGDLTPLRMTQRGMRVRIVRKTDDQISALPKYKPLRPSTQ
jgi:hypothetical protein